MGRLRRYERIRFRQVARAADLATTENTNKYRPQALPRLVPTRWSPSLHRLAPPGRDLPQHRTP
jgi:hypothetical protein